MTTRATDQSRQTLFEAMVVYAKAPVNKEGEHQVIYEKGKVRNLNAFEKITNSILNFVGYGAANKLKASLHSVKAKDSVTTKLKDNLLKTLSAIEVDETKNQINTTDLIYTTADNFLNNAISHIKDKKIYATPKSKPAEHTSNSGFSKEQYQALNNQTQKLEEISDSSFGHLPFLVSAAIENPSIEKFVKILLENNETKIDALKLITMANQASRIKDSLRCDSKKAVAFIKTLDFNEIDKDEYQSRLAERVDNFIKSKKKYNLDGESAKDYSVLMENIILKEHGLNKIEMLDVVHKFYLTSNKINKSKKIETISYNKDQLLERIIENYALKKHYPEMKKFIKEENDIFDKKTIEVYAIEMTNTAYSLLSKTQKYDAALKFITEKNLAKENSSNFNEKEKRNSIARAIENEINFDLPLDENGNYDQNKDPFYYERL